MLHRRDDARFLPDVTLGILAKEFNLFLSDQRILFLIVSESFRFLLANSKQAVFSFTEEWLLSGSYAIRA
jgi:hypothetical protein